MATLAEELQRPKSSLDDFREICERLLNYMADVIDEQVTYQDYTICSSTIAQARKSIRPFNTMLLVRDVELFNELYEKFEKIISDLKNGRRHFQEYDYTVVNKITYTIQQVIGCGLDLLVEQNSARKHVGNRFEELIRAIFSSLAIPNKKVVLQIPYETEEGEKYYRCETDVVVSPFQSVKSNSKDIHPQEIVISLKTTTKDRMPKIFIDKLLMEKFLSHSVRILGVSQNDVQRKEHKDGTKISYTFVSNLFMVYTRFLAELEGYYYLDLPKKVKEFPFSDHIFPFSKLIIDDIWKLLAHK